MTHKLDNTIVTVTLRVRDRNAFGDFEEVQMTVAEARELRQKLAGRTFANTRKGDRVFLGVGGTLSQIYATGGK